MNAINYAMAASHIGARHQNGVCEASRVWKLVGTGTSLYEVFKAGSSCQRAHLTGRVLHEVQRVNEQNDPVLGCAGDLVVNWWHSNNGVRIAIDCGSLTL